MDYETIKSLSEKTGVCAETVRRRVREMRAHVGKGERYPASSLIADGRNTRVKFEDYCDFVNHRKELEK